MSNDTCNAMTPKEPAQHQDIRPDDAKTKKVEQQQAQNPKPGQAGQSGNPQDPSKQRPSTDKQQR